MWLVKVVFLIVLLQNANSARILAIFPVTARSHYILGSSLTRALAERGHDVTMISPFGEEHPPKNGSYTDIVLTGFKERHDEMIKSFDMFGNTMNLIPMPILTLIFSRTFINMTENVFQHPNVQALINSDQKFDMIIIEEFLNDALKGLAPYFGGHLVILSTIRSNPWVNSPLGNPNPLAYIADQMSGFPTNMTLYQRITNTLNYVFIRLIHNYATFPSQEAMMRKYLPDVPSLTEIVHNVSLALLNSHVSVNPPVPYVPQMIDIGGYHVKPPKKLPAHLQEYLDKSKNGVIYFSLGSHIKSSFMPIEKRQIFIDVLSKLKEDVLWKFEEDLPDKPDNVRIEKWLPQQDILAHPNVKLFITHSGLLSTIETIYHGMPTLAVPIGGDQIGNANSLVNQGIGLSVPFHALTEELLSDSLHKLLNDPQYRENAETRSKIFHDRQVKPMDLATYWIEYILRNNGGSHLRVAAVGMPFYKYFLLDVIAVLAICNIVIFYLSCRVMRIICSKCTRKVKKDKKNQ